MPLSIFGFRALWSPIFMIVVLAIIIGFFLLTTKYRHKFEDSEPLTIKQASIFTVAMILLYVIKGSPIDVLAHIMFTFHMVQMAFLYLVIPPLIVASVPPWVWRKVIALPLIRNVFGFFTKPLIALVLFNGIFSFYHIPMVMDFVKMNIVLHTAYTIVLFILAIFLWWPLLNKLEGQYRLHGLKKIAYLVGDAVLLTPACGLIIFSPDAMYGTYTDGAMWLKAMELCVPNATLSALPPSITGPELFSNMLAVEDQQLGGVLMKVIQEIVLGTMLIIIFFEWYNREQKDADEITREALEQHQKHLEVNRL